MKILILIISSIFAIQVIKFQYQPKVGNKKVYVSPSKNINYYSFGYNDLISSLMWVRLLQDIDFCDQNTQRSAYPELKKEEDALGQVLTRKLPKSRCENGWVYQMLDVISDLSPDFKPVYTDGAIFLSVLVDDREGAQKIFRKGQIFYPENWEIHYRAAYHELFEMQNPESAAELLKEAGEKGGPRWVYALAAKLYTRLGQAQFAKTVLESVLERHHDGVGMPRVRAQLDKINKILEDAQ